MRFIITKDGTQVAEITFDENAEPVIHGSQVMYEQVIAWVRRRGDYSEQVSVVELLRAAVAIIDGKLTVFEVGE